ncbi:MAG: ABC transporter permease [Bradymonadales bacterium]|nr:ABC transporter permease [Bradymonadales bacterium]
MIAAAFRQLVPLGSIAFNTYREAARSKILYSILFFALFLILFSAVMGEVSLYQNERIIKDIGLFALSTFGALMAVFLGASFVYKEIERKSIYNIVSKPIHRWQYFIGKFFGIVATLLVQLVLMLIALLAVLWLWLGALPWVLLPAFVLICVEVCLVTTIALFFSSFSTPYLSGFLTIGTYVAGRSSYMIQQLASRVESEGLRFLLDLADRLLPALYIFDVSTEVTYNLPIPTTFLLQAAAYGLCYAAILLFLGSVIFSRRDFT